MDIFEHAKAHANELAPPPADRPLAAALTSFGFGLLVIGVFLALRWMGASELIAWVGAAVAYGGIGYADSHLGWTRHRRAYQDALADLKGQAPDRSIH